MRCPPDQSPHLNRRRDLVLTALIKARAQIALAASTVPQIDVDLAQEVTKAAEKPARLISRLEGRARHVE